jgi:flagellar motor protein MotB
VSRASTTCRTAEAFARGVSKQQEGFQALTQGWVGAYRDFFSPLALVQEGMRAFQRATQQGLEATQQVIRQGLEATEQVSRHGLRVAEEVTEHTEQVLRQSEEATREAQLRTAVFGALKITDYEGLSVAEISRRLEGLTIKQLEEIREYEKQNKNRETLMEQIERKKRAKNNSS